MRIIKNRTGVSGDASLVNPRPVIIPDVPDVPDGTLSDSRNHFRSSTGKRVLPEVRHCYIEITDSVIMKKQTMRTYFKYFVGDPVMATAFRLLWFANQNDRKNGVPPISDLSILPAATFFPDIPIPSQNEQTGHIDLVFPANLGADSRVLYPSLQLIE